MEVFAVKEKDVLVVEIDVDRMPQPFREGYIKSTKDRMQEAFPKNKILILASMSKVKINIVQTD